MKSRILVAVVLMLPTLLLAQSLGDLKDATPDSVSEAASSAADSMSGSLTDVLQGQLGISESQADGGVGTMLSLANEKLNAGEFDKLAGMIPGADKYMADAKSLGAVTGKLGGMDGVNAALGKLGISPETISKFTPMVTDYLGKLGGSDVQGMLAKAFGS